MADSGVHRLARNKAATKSNSSKRWVTGSIRKPGTIKTSKKSYGK